MVLEDKWRAENDKLGLQFFQEIQKALYKFELYADAIINSTASIEKILPTNYFIGFCVLLPKRPKRLAA